MSKISPIKPEQAIDNKKCIVRGSDGNIFLSSHDGKGWVCTKGKHTNYFADGYVVEYEYLED